MAISVTKCTKSRLSVGLTAERLLVAYILRLKLCTFYYLHNDTFCVLLYSLMYKTWRFALRLNQSPRFKKWLVPRLPKKFPGIESMWGRHSANFWPWGQSPPSPVLPRRVACSNLFFTARCQWLLQQHDVHTSCALIDTLPPPPPDKISFFAEQSLPVGPAMHCVRAGWCDATLDDTVGRLKLQDWTLDIAGPVWQWWTLPDDLRLA